MATVSPTTLFNACEQKLQLLGLMDDSDAPVTNAAVVATMNDQSGTPVAELNGVTLASIGGGNYSFTIPATFNQPIGNYVCVITVSTGGILRKTIKRPITVADEMS